MNDVLKNSRDLAHEIIEWVQVGSPFDDLPTEHLALRLERYVSRRVREAQAEMAQRCADKLISDKEKFECENGQVDPETGCWEATNIQEQHCVTLEESAEAILALSPDPQYKQRVELAEAEWWFAHHIDRAGMLERLNRLTDALDTEGKVGDGK